MINELAEDGEELGQPLRRDVLVRVEGGADQARVGKDVVPFTRFPDQILSWWTSCTPIRSKI